MDRVNRVMKCLRLMAWAALALGASATLASDEPAQQSQAASTSDAQASMLAYIRQSLAWPSGAASPQALLKDIRIQRVSLRTESYADEAGLLLERIPCEVTTASSGDHPFIRIRLTSIPEALRLSDLRSAFGGEFEMVNPHAGDDLRHPTLLQAATVPEGNRDVTFTSENHRVEIRFELDHAGLVQRINIVYPQ